MVRKKNPTPKHITTEPKAKQTFMGLSQSQTRSLGIGIILVGIVLFALAGYSYNNRETLTRSILPDGAAITPTPTDVPTKIGRGENPDTLTTPGAVNFGSEERKATQATEATPAPSVTGQITLTMTPTPTKEASETATTERKQLAIKKLPNTSSKVTYTVMRNDNVAKIGKQLCGSERAWLSLIRTNNLMHPYIIHPGQTLIITCN